MSNKINVNDLEKSEELTEDAASQIKGGAGRKVPSLHKTSDVTLKRGTLDSSTSLSSSGWPVKVPSLATKSDSDSW